MRVLITICLLLGSICLGIAAPVQLRFVVWDGDEALKAIRAAVGEFEAAHPHIKVKVEAAGWANYQEKLLAQYAAKVAPDVAMMDPVNFQKYAKRGALINLSTFIQGDPEFDLSKYYEPIVKVMSYQGDPYVLPRDIAPIGLIYYNKDQFDDAGIPFPDGNWTWDFQVRESLKEKDFLWVMRELTEPGKRYGFTPGWPQAIADVFAFSQGARYVDNPEAPTKVLLDDPRIVRAYQLLQDLSYEKKWIPSTTELSSNLLVGATDLFIQGKTAMMQSGIWEVPNLRKKLIKGQPGWFEWDIALAPAYKDGTRAMPCGGSGYCILSSTAHPKEAWELTKWMAGPPAMKIMAKTGLAQPAIREIALQEPWIPGNNTPDEQAYPHNRIITDQAVPFVVFEPSGDYWQEIWKLAGGGLDRVYLKSTTAKEGLSEARRRAEARLKDILEAREKPRFPWAIGGTAAGLLLCAIAAWVYWPERRRRLTHKEKVENRAGYLFVAPWIIGLLTFTLGPMIFSLLMSFSDWDIILPARFRGLENFQEAIVGDPRFWISLKVTLIYTLVAVPVGLAISLALALLLNQKVKGIPLWRSFFYLPSLASGVAAALIWRSIFKADGGLLNSLLSPFMSGREPINWLGNEQTALPAMIIMSFWGAGAGMVILLAGLQAIPEFYYEAAKVDGAGPIRRFFQVTLPLLAPSLLFTLITGIISSFQVFTQAFVMTEGGPNDATRFYMLHLYNQAFTSLRMGYASALAWILFFIVLAFTALQLKLSKRIYYEAGSP